MNLTDNFLESEFTCKCGCELPEDIKSNLIKLTKNLEIIRSTVNKPIKVNSGYRCTKHNEKIGGKKKSFHLSGLAADIEVFGIKPKELADIIEKLMNENKITKGGIGIYKTFIHFDIRGTKVKFP